MHYRIYVCMYVCMFIHNTYIHTFINTHIHTYKRRYVAETEGSKAGVDVLWACDERKCHGERYHDGIRRGRQKKRLSDEEVDGGNTHDVRNGSCGAEGCGGGSGACGGKLTMTFAK